MKKAFIKSLGLVLALSDVRKKTMKLDTQTLKNLYQ